VKGTTPAFEPLDPDTRRRIEGRLERIPLARTLGVRLARLERGECDLALDDRRDLDGIVDSLHGGILTTLADSAIAFAALTLIGPDERITTVELNIRFLAPCREGVVAQSRVVRHRDDAAPARGAGRVQAAGHYEWRGSRGAAGHRRALGGRSRAARRGGGARRAAPALLTRLLSPRSTV